MQFTPDSAVEHLKESIATYLESQYRISHPLVFEERGALLRQNGVIAQDPFIEATPAFAAARFLRDLEESRPDAVPKGLSELMEHGIPLDRFPLYTHQQKALLSSFGESLGTCSSPLALARARPRLSSFRYWRGSSRRPMRGKLHPVLLSQATST